MPHQPSAADRRDRPAPTRPGSPGLGPYETTYDVVRGYDDVPRPGRGRSGGAGETAYFGGRERRP